MQMCAADRVVYRLPVNSSHVSTLQSRQLPER